MTSCSIATTATLLTTSSPSHADTFPAASKRASKIFQTLSSGREFYDDGYTEEECNAAELPCSTLIQGVGSAFFGRSKDLETLHRIQHQVIDVDDGPLPGVLVWGVSGTGKSRLIQQFLNEIKQQSACYVLQGKCDEHTGSSDPFSAIVQALNDLSAQLKNGPVEELERIRGCIRSAYTNNNDNGETSALSALINVAPSLSVLLQNDHDSSGFIMAGGARNNQLSTSDSASIASLSSQYSLAIFNRGGGITENAWNRLQYIFLHFVKAISTQERPVYLFLDDLQWSSPVALELLANLVSDPELKHFLFLGSIRQETNPHNEEVLEVATTSALSASFLSRFQSQDKELTHVSIQDMSLGDTVKFISNFLSGHPIDDNLNDLAQKIYAKTQGNIFFTVQALEELQRKHVLIFCRISFQWTWVFDGANGDDISISNNIVGAIESKLRQLPQDLQDVLSIAAYVRATFDVATLAYLIQNEQRCAGASPFFAATTETITMEYLSTLLEKAVLEQLLQNPIGGTTYRFVHDRIQQAAHGMIADGEERDMLRLRIGHCLLRLYRHQHDDFPDLNEGIHDFSTNNDSNSYQGPWLTEDDHSLLFVAADHLNSVPTKGHMFSAMLNLEVGERAIQMAALDSAAGYLERAATELQRVRSPWDEHYDMCLRLYRARCDVELSLGHFQLGYSFGDVVLAKARSLDEKLPTYLSMAHGLGREDKHLQALDVCLSVTTQMGEFPKRWYAGHIARDMTKINSFLKKNDDDAIMQLPLMTDERNIMSIKLLTELGVRAILTQHIIVWLVAICKRVRNTIQYGLSENSAVAFASFGIFSAARGDQAMAMRCARLAKRIISKANGNSLAGHVSFVTAAFIVPFKSPIVDVIQEHRQGYIHSMEAGEFEIGFANWQMSIITAYLAGYKLQPLIQATETTLQQYKMYRVESMGNKAEEYLSMMQMMAGKKSIDWDDIEESANRTIKKENLDPSDRVALNFHFYCRMVLATYFRKHELAHKLGESYRYVTSDEKTCFAIVSKGLYPGLNAAARYRETGKRKHLRMLKKMLADLRTIAKTRGSKFIHHVLMLKAELASIQKQNSQCVKDAYDLAILLASNSSFVQDAALICELAGEHRIREGCPKAETSDYFVQAVGFYEDWGCVAKIQDLKQRQSEYLTGLNDTNNRKTRGRNGIFSDIVGENTFTSRQTEMNVQSIHSSVGETGTMQMMSFHNKSTDGEEDDDDLSVLTDGI